MAAGHTQVELFKKAITPTRTIPGIEKGTSDAELTAMASIARHSVSELPT
jgi:hypothetical protein